ncbi:hypothetical protein [Bradyrhizobium sp. BR13661]|jgi:hypothetical protein|uniref:hypothetical protein n=1 Tax=Bradyrhizobium sp. BR13661 TaxID=2940622 RepID=UPI0024738EC5|nr:hypothetical protein [Bradyrhizobium sp. BR13661]MDH6260445.1 hypothetical protein [Bradyrhizobium sp. BR13661]
MTDSSDMLNFIEVFNVMNVDPDTGHAVWSGLTGSRSALQRDGFMVDPKAGALCPKEWLDERGYLDAELARQHPRPWGI